MNIHMNKVSKKRADEIKRQMSQLQSQLAAVESEDEPTSVDEFYGYIRLSTAEQAEVSKSGDDRQRSSIESYCKKEKLTITEWLEDEGRSGFHAKNLSLTAELGSLVEKVKHGEIIRPTIIAETMSRITRITSEEAVQYILDLTTQHDITFITTVDSMIYKKGKMGMIGVIKLSAYAEAAHAESLEKRNRALGAYRKEIRKYKEDNSYVLMHTPPNWIRKTYEVEGKRATGLELIPERVEVVKRIFKLSREGKGNIVISNLLNNENVPTFGNRKNSSGKWYPAVIGNILRNKAAYGTFEATCGEELFIINKYYQPVISANLFNKCQKTIKTRKTDRNIATGRLATLGLTVEIDGVNTSFCYTVRKNKTKSETVNYYYRRGKHGTNALRLESIIYDYMVNGKIISQSNRLFKRVPKEVQQLSTELQLLESQRSSYEYMIQNSGDVPTHVLDKAIELEKEIQSLKNKIELLNADNIAIQIAEESRSGRINSIKRCSESDRENLKELYTATISRVVIEKNVVQYIELHGKARIDVGMKLK